MASVDGIVLAHAALGGLALLTMVVPLVTRKGGRTHRRWGRAYAYTLAGVVVLAWTVVGLRIAEGRSVSTNLFLALVGLLAGACVWAGWRVRHERGRSTPHRDVLDHVVQAALVVAGLAAAAFGALQGGVLFLAFGLLCVAFGGNELRVMRTVPSDADHWMMRHIGAMIGACIATVTAFLVVNLKHLPPEVSGALPSWLWWLLPTFLGVPGIVVWSRAWRRDHPAT